MLGRQSDSDGPPDRDDVRYSDGQHDRDPDSISPDRRYRAVTAMRFYLAAMFAVVLLDLFDKLVERYGHRVTDSNWLLPDDKAIVFGVYEDVRRNGLRRDVRFLFIKIPFVKTWGITNLGRSPIPEYGLRSHTLRWIDIDDPFYGGWRIDPPLEG